MLSRRSFLSAGAALAMSAPLPAIASPMPPLFPPSKGKRVVICGGGWGGVTAAKYMRLAVPEAEVILLERNANFFSCPMSNKWLVDIVATDFLLHDYLAPARKYGYTVVQTEVSAIERDNKTVFTTQGRVPYDYLILAAGIGYDYGAWFGDDREAASYTRKHFPSAYSPSAEHLTVKRKVQGFEGGDFVMTLPPPPHRCPPSPYERACLFAWRLKTKGIKGRITILDPKPAPAPIGEGYRRAFDELYKDQIAYVPNAKVLSVDPYGKSVTTAAGQFRFDDAILMAPHRAGDMVRMADLIGRDKDGRSTGWADQHPLYLHANGDPDVFVIGDSVGRASGLFGFYPKSGHVANRLAKMATRHIACRMADQPLEKLLPDNLCFMMVNGAPREAISVQFGYGLADFDEIEQKTIEINERSATLVESDFDWAAHMYEDMFG